MTVSQNGWPANRRDLVSSRLVPGTAVRLTVRNGAAGDLLLEVASLFHRLVRRIDTGVADDWGYAERTVRGSTSISNHASGTAVDINATCWSLGQSASVYLTPSEIATVRRIVAATDGVIRWGGDYTGRRDPMHFEVNDGRTEADCARALARLRAAFGTTTAPVAPTPPTPREDDPVIRIPITLDADGTFYETVTLDGGATRYVATATVLLASDRGGASFTVTARDHSGAEGPLYQWHHDLPNHGFAAEDLPKATRLLVIEGKVANPGARPTASVLVKAAG